MNIDEIRNDIDKVDSEMVGLFKKRIGLVKAVAEYKKQNKMPILDSERERKLLNKISEEAGEDIEVYARVLFSNIMDLIQAFLD